MYPQSDIPGGFPIGPFRGQPRPVAIEKVRRENSVIKSFILADSLETAMPGQFVMAWLPDQKEAPFSIADDDPLTLTVAKVGSLTEQLHRLTAGDRIWIRGPFGRGFAFIEHSERPILAGGGYGAAPLAFLVRFLRREDRNPIAVLGGRTGEDIIGLTRFASLGIETMVATEDGTLGEQGLITSPIERLLSEGRGDALYGVGPNPMLEALRELARRYSIPVQLSYEGYIGCGMGLCGRCEHTDGSLLCTEGPVRLFLPHDS